MCLCAPVDVFAYKRVLRCSTIGQVCLVLLPCCCARELEVPKLGMSKCSPSCVLKLQVPAVLGGFIFPPC